MKIVFASKLKSFLNAVAEEFELYVSVKNGNYFTYRIYDPSGKVVAEFSDIRVCTPVKEFLFPMRELVATYPNELKFKIIKECKFDFDIIENRINGKEERFIKKLQATTMVVCE